MQPELPEVSRTASVTASTQNDPDTPRQHGIHRDDGSASHGSPRGQEGRAAAPDGERSLLEGARAGDGDDAFDKDEEGDRGFVKDERDDDDLPTTLEDDIVDASPKSRRKATKPPTGSSPISNLPNEILTHALSHLPPADLTSTALVCKRFHALVTTPHAWRTAFARFFPGPTATITTANRSAQGRVESFRSDKRAFCRLTALSTWRSEYILRTRLLRSLARGKPSTGGSAGTPRGHVGSGSAVMMYNAQGWSAITHADATFGTGLAKNYPRFIHGADEFGQVSISDPTSGRVENWGFTDPQGFRSFADHHGGTTMYGLGAGEVIGVPNVMSLSQPNGMVYGEGLPDGSAYYRGVDEPRGRFLLGSAGVPDPEQGIPSIRRQSEAVSAVWIAKTAAIPSLTEGLLGIMTGSSLGVVSAYSLGSTDMRHLRLGRGELTARWVLSPGVPIIAIAVDESYSLKRQAQNRIWAVALNALGELFYLTKFPKRQPLPRNSKLDEATTVKVAWTTGRSIYWNLVESSRREARPDPYGDLGVDGSYSPRTSWNGMCLSNEQIKAETREIEVYLKKQPKEFQKLCNGWDMRRKLEIDWAGDDGNFAGEAFVVFECGLEENSTAMVKRFTRLKVLENDGTVATESEVQTPDDERTPVVERDSLFGPAVPVASPTMGGTPPIARRGRGFSSVSYNSLDASPERAPTVEEWRVSHFALNGTKGNVQISATTIDSSTYATLTLSEDPAVGMLGSSEASSAFGSPLRGDDRPITPSDIPGQRARYLAAGTKAGNVYVWDVRAAASKSTDLINIIEPIRIIYTDSPEISCLAMTALQIAVGGNDGLVQVWDPLASSLEPIRTINSRFSSRARRRLAQANASAQGVGINMFAAGAICLDPDPSVLRGMVTLGTHIRYWSYSATSADQYKGSKRRLRRSERGSNQHHGEFMSIRNSSLKSYLAHERNELEQENQRRRMERARMQGRFGIGMMEDEEQALAYAALLSEESLAQDEARRASQVGTPATDAGRFATPTKETGAGDVDADLAEAIRRSLEGDDGVGVSSPQDVAFSPTDYSPSPSTGAYDVPIRMARGKGRRGSPKSSSRSPPTPLKPVPEASGKQEMDDLDFALQLSLAEEQSRADASVGGEDDFPALPGNDKGKGKGRAQ